MSGTPTPAFAAAIAHHRQGRLDAAAAAYRAVLAGAMPPNERRAAATNLGRMLLASGEAAGAVPLLRQAVDLDGTRADLWRDLGGACLAAGDAADAVAALRCAVALDGGDATAATNLAVALEAMGDRAAATAALDVALRLAPHQPEALNLRGTLHLAAGEVAAALIAFDAALAARPDYPEALLNRGLALLSEHRWPEAVAPLRRAVALRSDFAAAHAALARALQSDGDPGSAAAAYRTALSLAPDTEAWRVEYGQLCLDSGHLAEAGEMFGAVITRHPGHPDALASLLHTRHYACDWDGLDELTADVVAVAARGVAVPPFVLVAAGAPDFLQTRNATAWGARVAPQRRPRPALRAPKAGAPLRIGYLSGDFHDHATAHLMVDLFERHDRRAVTITGYSYGPDDGSPMRHRLAAAFDAFRDIATAPAADAATCIEADRIDILVDLKGYTAGARPEIPALRPAPVQVNWLGYPGSMGVEFIDYVLADAIVAPAALQPFCTEHIVHLPHCFQPNDAGRPIGITQPRAAYGLPDDAFVFCCFNNSYKIGPTWFALWMSLLADMPGSVLWLLDSHPPARTNLQARATAAGIDPERLVFAPRLPQAEHLARHRAADLFLDTLPVNALTTASDALWAGLPVLTCRGDTVAGRGCASLLNAAGLPDLVIETSEAYKATALALARSPARMSALKQRCATHVRGSPLYDTETFARDLEAAFRRMIAVT